MSKLEKRRKQIRDAAKRYREKNDMYNDGEYKVHYDVWLGKKDNATYKYVMDRIRHYNKTGVVPKDKSIAKYKLYKSGGKWKTRLFQKRRDTNTDDVVILQDIDDTEEVKEYHEPLMSVVGWASPDTWEEPKPKKRKLPPIQRPIILNDEIKRPKRKRASKSKADKPKKKRVKKLKTLKELGRE